MRFNRSDTTPSKEHKIIPRYDFFYFIFVLWYSGELLLNTSADTIFGIDTSLINNISSWTIFAFLIIQIIFLQRYDYTTLIIITVITFFVCVSVVLSGSRYIMSTWMFIVGSMYAELDRVITIAKRILLIGIPLIIGLFAMGLLDDYTLYRHGTLPRHSLGFSHPNQLGLRVFQLVLCIIYLDRKKITTKDFVIIAAAACFCYYVPNSQTATIMLVVLFFLIMIYKLIELRMSNRHSSYTLVLIICSIAVNALSVFLSIIDVSRKEFLSLIDKFLSFRFSACHRLYEMYGVTVFGNRVYVSQDERKLAGLSYSTRYWLDNSYMYMLLKYGVITFVIFVTIYYIGMHYFRKKKESILVIIMFLYSVYGIMEIGLFSMQHNVFLLSLGYVLYEGVREYINQLKTNG